MPSVLMTHQGLDRFDLIFVGLGGAPATHPLSQVLGGASSFGDFELA